MEKEVEKKFLSALSKIPQNSKLLIAVSGGADSIALLSLCQHYADFRNLKLFVASINHNLRPKDESFADIVLVQNFCKTLTIPCYVKTAEPGLIEKIAKKRKKGLEEAARFFRYEFLETCAKELEADYILTAHNKNDHLETIVSQFLQGSFVSSGIEMLRKPFFKPLLECSRDEIEAYIKKNALNYAIDKTNFETIFFRNKIRNILLPFLDRHFFGWQKAVLTGAKKKAIDERFFASILEDYSFEFLSPQKARFPLDYFYSLEKAIQIRLLYKTFSSLFVHSRVSYAVIESILEKKPIQTKEIEIRFTKVYLIIKKKEKMLEQKKNFFAIVEKECNFITNYGTILITKEDFQKKDAQIKLFKKNLVLPFSFLFDGKQVKTKVLGELDLNAKNEQVYLYLKQK